MQVAKRSVRRHHYERLKNRWFVRIRGQFGTEDWEDSYVWECAAFRANTPKTCSSFCCGNPRKWFGERTIQERRHDDA